MYQITSPQGGTQGHITMLHTQTQTTSSTQFLASTTPLTYNFTSSHRASFTIIHRENYKFHNTYGTKSHMHIDS